MDLLEVFKLTLLVLTFIFFIVTYVKSFFGLSKKEQKRCVREWLLEGVAYAEKQLGSKTGRLKLSLVYGLFVVKFPQVARWLPFDVFSGLVDDALEELEVLMDTNITVKGVINGGSN